MDRILTFGRIKCSKIIETNEQPYDALNVPGSVNINNINGYDNDALFFDNLKKKFMNKPASSSLGCTKSHNIVKCSSRKKVPVFDEETQHLIKTFKQNIHDRNEVYKTTLTAFHTSNSKNASTSSNNRSHKFCFKPRSNIPRYAIRPYDNSREIYNSKAESVFECKGSNVHESLRQNGVHQITNGAHIESLISHTDVHEHSVQIEDVIYGDICITPPRLNYSLWE